jgi:diguanylate cyclase (GGDEF)-like protein
MIIFGALALSALICLVLGLFSFIRAQSKGRYYSFSVMLLSAATYSFFYLLELTKTNMASLLLCVGFEYLSISLMTVCVFFVTRDFGGTERAKIGLVALVSIIPAVTATLAFTVRSHELLYIEPTMTRISGISILTFTKGPWYWVNIVYVYGILLYGAARFTISAITHSGSRRVQARFMLAGTFAPFIASMFYQTGLIPANIDPTPFSFMIAGSLLSIGFFKYRLFDIQPLAREIVFEQMRDAAIVVNQDGMLIDHNKAARAFFPILGNAGRDIMVEEVYEGFSSMDTAVSGGEILIFDAGKQTERSYEVRRSSVRNNASKEIGVIFILIDVTERERLQEQLHELASMDELTKVPNRRRFYELANIELERARRHGRPISFAIMDMDGFKNINDQYGHSTGDEALRLAARLSVDAIRSCDIVGRIGGDEFAFVFPECDEVGAVIAADKIRKVVGSATFASGSGLVTLSVSIGTIGSSGPSHADLEEMLMLADERMYADKAVNKVKSHFSGPRRRAEPFTRNMRLPHRANQGP